jgi:hypothetical protein
MEDKLAKTVSSQESWVSKTAVFLPKAFRRIKRLANMHNHSIPEYYGAERTPRIDSLLSWSGFFPFTFSPSFLQRVVGARRRILSLSRFSPFNSRGRLRLTQASGLYPTQKSRVSRVQGSRRHHGGFFLRTDCDTFS